MTNDGVSPLLVGRRVELDLLRVALDDATAGRFRMVLVGGEAGVGKSRLVSELVEQSASSGRRVLLGSCVEGGGEGMPFAPVVDVLRTLVRGTLPADLDAVLGRARREVARLLPEVDGAAKETSQVGSSAQLFELLLAVLVRVASSSPLLVIIEDLHWADQSTLDFIAFLTRALDDVEILLVATYRSDEMHRSHPMRPLLATWERSRQVTRLDLSRFSPDEVREQLTGILGRPPEDALSRLVMDRSEGNAFLVEEILGALQAGADPDTLPPSLQDVLLTRVDQLSLPARQLLSTASVAGRWVGEKLLATVTRLPSDDLYGALREVVEHHQMVVDDSGRGYMFRHALTRDAVYTDMLPGERSALHLAYGEALEADPDLAGPGLSISATLAFHWYAALDLPRALDASVEAARAAASAAAFAEAQRHLERALEIWPRVPDAVARTGTTLGELLGESGIAACNAGQVDRALTQLDKSVAAISTGDSSDAVRAVALERRAIILHGLGREEDAAADLRAALDLLGPGSLGQRAAVLAMLANTQRLAGDPEAGMRTAREAVDTAREAERPDYEADALVTLGTIAAYDGDVDAGTSAVRQGLELAKDLPNQEIVIRAYANLSDVLELAGDHQQAASVARDGAAIATEAGFARSFGVFLLANQMEPLLKLGRWDEVEQVATNAMQRDPTGVFRTSLLDLLAQVAAYRGEYEVAERHLRAAMSPAADSGAQYMLPILTTTAHVQRARGELLLARQSVQQALSDRNGEQDGRYLFPLLAVGFGVEADLRQLTPDRQSGIDSAEEVHATLIAAQRRDPPTTNGERAFAAVATAEQARTRATTGPVDLWQAALTSAQEADDIWLRLYVLLRLAQARAEDGKRPEAAQCLRTLVTESAALRAKPLHDQALLLARSAGLQVAPEVETSTPPNPPPMP